MSDLFVKERVLGLLAIFVVTGRRQKKPCFAPLP